MRIQKRLFTIMICMALLILSIPVNASAADDFPTILAEAKKGVVQIYSVYSDNRYVYASKGTGFAVGEAGQDSNIFLTNWHVITGSGEYPVDEARVWILQENCEIDENTFEPDPTKSITCEILKTTDGHPDYAILRATEQVEGYKPMPLLSSKEVPDGTTVYALGFPGVVEETSANHYGIDDITATNGIISQHMQYVHEDNNWVLLHTATISKGNSGGPLITADGYVVGLNTYGYSDFEQMQTNYYAVYIDYAIDGLEELGLPYENASAAVPEADPEESGTSEEETEDPEETSEEDDKKGSDDSDEDEDHLLLWIAASGAAIAVIALFVFIRIKKKKEQELLLQRQEAARRQQEAARLRQEEERRMAEDRRRQEEERRRHERQVIAQLQLNGGTVYPVRANGCIIGRQPDCSIVLPEGTSGVSRHHCKLEMRNGQLILTDLNSSYGTYIHGKRIPANTPVALTSGSSFCLGSEQCRFTVY